MEEQIVDNLSVKSKRNVHNMKVCAFCGKQEGKHWTRHCNDKHNGNKKEWDGHSELIDFPWCENWKVMIDAVEPKPKPVNILPSFKRGFKAGNKLHEKRSTKSDASNSDNSSSYQETVYNESQFAPEEIQIQISEKVKNDFVVPQPRPLSKSTTTSLLGKRKTVKLDEPTEEEMISSCDKVETMFCVNKRQQFEIPAKVVSTVYVQQGQRDIEAIQNLATLEMNTTGNDKAKVAELIKLTPFFSQAPVSYYIEQNKISLTKVKDLIMLAQQDVEQLKPDSIASLAFASVLFGGSVWAALPKMLAALEYLKLKDTLSLLQSLLAGKFNANLAQWICHSWQYIEEQTLPLLRYLKEQQHLGDLLVADIATISRMVQIGDMKEYLTLLEVFSQYRAFNMIKQCLKTSAPQWKSEQKLKHDKFCDLIGFIMKSRNQQLILKNETDLIALPLNQWLDKLILLQNASEVCDVESIQYRLNQLCELFGVLPLQKQSTDLTLSEDGRFQRTLNMVPNAPNTLQFANAQYAAFGLVHWKRQMWIIPSGQGKSRTLATIALILLLTGATTKVHIVFDSAHFMKRDQREFACWWQMNGFSGNVEYHVGLDFEGKTGDIILIDESDQVILRDHAKFEKKVKSNGCICVTATPHNDNKKGVERELLELSDFKFIHGQPQGVILPTLADISCLPTLPLSSGPDLTQHLLKVLQETAVLLYCSQEFQQLLSADNIPFVLIQDGQEDIDDEFLRTLDIRPVLDGPHTLLVTSSSFGMRGFDYRAPTKGITLVIAASFEHQRQAIQGLDRVGRFGDPCKKMILQGIALVDKVKEMDYQAVLFQYLNKRQQNKIQFNLKEEQKKIQPNAASNTAKNTPVVGKSGSKKGQQQSSQTTLTGIPHPKNYTKRQIQLAPALTTTPKKREQKQKGKEDNDEEEERIVITDSQMLSAMQQ